MDHAAEPRIMTARKRSPTTQPRALASQVMLRNLPNNYTRQMLSGGTVGWCLGAGGARAVEGVEL